MLTQSQVCEIIRSIKSVHQAKLDECNPSSTHFNVDVNDQHINWCEIEVSTNSANVVQITFILAYKHQSEMTIYTFDILSSDDSDRILMHVNDLLKQVHNQTLRSNIEN